MYVQQTTFKFLTNLLCRNFYNFQSFIWLQKLSKAAVNEILPKALSLILIKERRENKRKKDFLDLSELLAVTMDVIKIMQDVSRSVFQDFLLQTVEPHRTLLPEFFQKDPAQK